MGTSSSIHRIRNATLRTNSDQAHALIQTQKKVEQGERYADLKRGDVVNICQSSQSDGQIGTHPTVFSCAFAQ